MFYYSPSSVVLIIHWLYAPPDKRILNLVWFVLYAHFENLGSNAFSILNIMVHSSVPNFRSQRGTPWMEAHQIVPYLLNIFLMWSQVFFPAKNAYAFKNSEKECKRTFSNFGHVYIKQLQFFRIPSNDKFNFDTCF